MARVPTYDNLQTQISPQPNVQVQAASGPQAGAIAAEQQGQMGRALMGAGGEVARIQNDMADMANQVRVNDAVNRARIAAQDLAYNKDTGYLNKKGSSAFLDDGGKPYEQPLSKQYGDKFKGSLDEIAASLGNDRQRQLFANHAGDLAATMNGQLQGHTLQQFGAYQDHVDDSKVKIAASDAALHYDNPDVIFGRVDPATGERKGGSIDEAKAALYSKAKRAGLVGEPLDAATLSGVSAIHERVIQAALQNNNPEYALQYMDKARKAGEMHPDDILKVQGHLNMAVDLRMAQGAVKEQTTAATPTLAPTGFDRMTQITLATESGGRRYAVDGKTMLESPKGAKGEMQVMDGTNTNPGYGVKPAKDNSPDERARVGRDYLTAMMRQYGEPDKAWAAYNGGPGALDKALNAARASRGGERTWLAYMPQETQAYVAKNMAALQGNAPVAARPTELEFVNGTLARLPANASPQAIKLTREAAVSQFGMINKSITEQGDNAQAEAQRWVLANKGAPIESMPIPLRDAVARFAPGKMDDIKKFGDSMAKNDAVTNPAVYMNLTNDANLKAKTDDQFFNLRTQLSESDFKAFQNHRADLLSGKVSNGSGDLNTSAINDTLKQRFSILKIDPTPKDGTDESVAMGVTHKYVRDKITEAQKQAGKKFSDAETATFIDGLFSKDVKFRNMYLGVSGAQQSRPLLSSKYGDIPGDLAAALKKDLQAKGKPIDEGTVLAAYLNLHH